MEIFTEANAIVYMLGECPTTEHDETTCLDNNNTNLSGSKTITIKRSTTRLLDEKEDSCDLGTIKRKLEDFCDESPKVECDTPTKRRRKDAVETNDASREEDASSCSPSPAYTFDELDQLLSPGDTGKPEGLNCCTPDTISEVKHVKMGGQTPLVKLRNKSFNMPTPSRDRDVNSQRSNGSRIRLDDAFSSINSNHVSRDDCTDGSVSDSSSIKLTVGDLISTMRLIDGIVQSAM